MVPSYYSAQVSPQKGSSNFARRDTWQILRVSITSTHYTVHTRSIHYTVHSMQYTVHARSIQYTLHITSPHGCVLIDPFWCCQPRWQAPTEMRGWCLCNANDCYWPHSPPCVAIRSRHVTNCKMSISVPSLRSWSRNGMIGFFFVNLCRSFRPEKVLSLMIH